MTAEELLRELAGKRLFATPQEKRKLIEKLAANTGLLPYPIPIILITGTCGKGSTTLFLSSILEAHGFRVGMVQSPHLLSFSERIQVNRTPLSEESILRQIDELLPALHQSVEPTENHPLGALNYNQLFLITGLHLFLQEKADFVLLETGIGGYNDPSTFFTPILSIITNVFMDHEAVLGNSFAQIAYDKSGVIKEGVPAITGTAVPEALDVLKTEAKSKRAPLYCLGEDFSVKAYGGEILYEEPGFELPYQLSVNGQFQWDNSSLAIKCCLLLHELGYPIQSKKIAEALACTELPGRFQVVGKSPLTVVDGAHNEEEIRRFCETVGKLGCEVNFFILSFSQDKRSEEMLGWFKGIPAVFLFAPHTNSLRVKDPKELASFLLREYGTEAHVFPSLEHAYLYAKSKARSTDAIFFTGSMFIAGDALHMLDKIGQDKEN
ncbi:folylpolyglutamate synthase/dihydrofolate synthase family protein [Ammoniphilus sp. 3BR4]|uniref:bifunctional folylpolyglutamate synthase/dihydrofolate synthase n=1 Tax=Ammoniphilus sp. 3BR4 TaxID=3158265 RepID=UPI003464EBB4